MDKKKATIWSVVLVALIGGAFVSGTFLSRQMPWARTAFTRGIGPGGAGGPMTGLSDEERSKLDAMSESERQAYLQEKMGGAVPAGGRMRGAGSTEGEILEVSDDSVTVKTTEGGSRSIYLDDDTVVAYAEGVTAGDLKKGDSVIALTEPEADGVIKATAVIVR